MVALVDVAALNRQTFDDAGIRREIIMMFYEQAPVIMAAIDASRGAARADAAHRLKGSALSLGAGPLAEAAGALEAKPDDAASHLALAGLLTATLAELALIEPR
jgi:HPt (histidine-containing phosphotransfer) domain-containing protein